MNSILNSELRPKVIWNLFEKISHIPRPSGYETEIRNWIKSWAIERNIAYRDDHVGNLILIRDASPMCEGYPTLILQCHLDMVASKLPSKEFNFFKDALELQVEGEKVKAKGTSLGADNGIGIAYCLALLSDVELQTGRIEVLFTVEEETGLKGAREIKPGFFSGKYLLNLDSENIGTVTIGSAGAEYTDYLVPLHRKKISNLSLIEIRLSGLAGGHSGIDIHLPRKNAIKIIIEGYKYISTIFDEIYISKIEGGNATNAIPSEALLLIAVHERDTYKASKIMTEWAVKIKKKYKKDEPGISIQIRNESSPLNADSEPISPSTRNNVIELLDSIPHGVQSFSKELKGLVQTSNNLAMIRTKKELIEIYCTTRSSINEELDELNGQLRLIGEKHEAEVKQHSRYPGWAASPRSSFSMLVKQIYESVLGKKVHFTAMHAGLECGIFKGLDPNLQIVSIGPQINNVHSTNESVNIDSVGIVWEILKQIVTSINTIT